MVQSPAKPPGRPPERRRHANYRASLTELEAALADLDREAEKWATAAATLRAMVEQRRDEREQSHGGGSADVERS